MSLLLLLHGRKAVTLPPDTSGWGTRTSAEPQSRTELRAADVGPRIDVLHDPDYQTAWGPRLATDPNDRQYDKANGGVATAVKDPENAAIAAWRLKYNPTP